MNDSKDAQALLNTAPLRRLTVERQWGQLVGTNIRTFDEQHTLVCFAKQKAFKLKEEVHFYHDEAQSQNMFSVKARNILDVSATYDIFDVNGTVVGSLRRKGIASAFVRDEWVVLDSNGQEIGSVVEDNALMGVIRRFVDFASYFLPQTYSITINGQDVGELKQRKNPFTVKYDYEISDSVYTTHSLLLLAIPNLLAIVEGRQN